MVVHGTIAGSAVWRLAAVSGRIETVHKSGERWTAELSVGSARVLVVGQAGAGIPVATMVQGRTARIVGIVRRAYPSASDQRPAVLPRSIADVAVASTGGAGGPGTTGNGAAGGSGNAVSESGSGNPPTTTTPNVHDVDLVDLASAVDETVRVGGLARELLDDGFRLDDGTAIGRVVLVGAAATSRQPIAIGDAVNATGRVVKEGDGTLVVRVDDAAAIVIGSDALAGVIDGSGKSVFGQEAAYPGTAGPSTLEDGPGRASPGVVVIVVVLGLLGVISVGAAMAMVLRRRRSRRVADQRLAGRIAAITTMKVASEGPPSGDGFDPGSGPASGPGSGAGHGSGDQPERSMSPS
jgi:hypothetical protein